MWDLQCEILALTRVQARMAWDAIMEVKDALGAVAEGVPKVKEQIETFVEEAKELASKAPEEAKGASLGVMEAITATKNTANNVKTLGSGPNVVQTVLQTCKRIGDEFKSAVDVISA